MTLTTTHTVARLAPIGHAKFVLLRNIIVVAIKQFCFKSLKIVIMGGRHTLLKDFRVKSRDIKKTKCDSIEIRLDTIYL